MTIDQRKLGLSDFPVGREPRAADAWRYLEQLPRGVVILALALLAWVPVFAIAAVVVRIHG